MIPPSPAFRASIERALNAIPASKQGAVQVDVTTEGAQAEVAWRFRPSWSVAAWGAVDWTGQREAGVRLKGAW